MPPIALCWLSGAIVGECLARGWRSVVAYATLLVTFGLAYAGSVRAVSSTTDARRGPKREPRSGSQTTAEEA